MPTYLDFWNVLAALQVLRIRKSPRFSLRFIKECIEKLAAQQGVVLTEGMYDNDVPNYTEDRGSAAFKRKVNPFTGAASMTHLQYWQSLPSECLTFVKNNGFCLESVRKFLVKKAAGQLKLIEGPGDHNIENFRERFQPGAKRRGPSGHSNGVPPEKRQKCATAAPVNPATAPVEPAAPECRTASERYTTPMDIPVESAAAPGVGVPNYWRMLSQTKRDEPLSSNDLAHDISASTPPPSSNVDFIPENPLEFDAETALNCLEPHSTQFEPGVIAQQDIAPSCCTNTNGARKPLVLNGARKPLVLNGLVIEVDPDTFMVNATQMCKAAGKEYYDYAKTAKAKSFLQTLKSKPIYVGLDLIKSNRGGDHSGTMVHRLIAYDLASWLSDDVRLQFFMWNDELLLTGRVELGNEMNVHQLEDVWKRRMQERQDRASADLSAEQDRCQKLEMQLATIQEAHQRSDEEKKALVAIKVREDLEAAIQYQARATAPTIDSYKEGDNVLYMARVDGTKFKYGHTKNLKQRLEAHGRLGVYPTFELVRVVKSNNGVASEDQLHVYVKKKKIIAEYGTQREVVVLESVDDLERMMNKMYKCALPRADNDLEIKRLEINAKTKQTEEETKRMEINARTKQTEEETKANVEKTKADVEKTKADVEIKKIEVDMETSKRRTMLMQMLKDKTITVEQYLQIKD